MTEAGERQRQVDREAAARQLAMGRRAKQIMAGHLGPVLKRWINADVVPIAALLRAVAVAYLAGDMPVVAALLDTPTAALKERERPLTPLMEWCLQGHSLGRGEETTYADDLALTFMATLVTRTAQDRVSLAAALAIAADNLRDTVQGQFISSVQGAGAMQSLREKNPKIWLQRKSLNRICAKLYAQVKPQLDRAEAAGEELLSVRGKKVVSVMSWGGTERELSLREPTKLEWEVMSLCWRDEADGGTHPYRSLWLGLAGMLLAAAIKTGGWFEVAEERAGRKGHTRTTKYLVLSEAAHETIKKDIARWTAIGFTSQPMVVPPEDGDYLTVKHRKVTGQVPPLGLRTDAANTSAWTLGAAALSSTPWSVNLNTLSLLESSPELMPDELASRFRLEEHKRVASEPAFYLPTNMDFRGRIYYRTPWVTPQSGDMGKALLKFPDHNVMMGQAQWSDWLVHLARHFTNLYGHGLDKMGMRERAAWFDRAVALGLPHEAPEKPLTFAAHWALMQAEETDSIPVQLDGTCNGLQHLTALLRDEVAAPLVNLARSSYEDAPRDIYGVVAAIASSKFDLWGTWGGSEEEPPVAWIVRFVEAGLKLDRKLLKGPVMVLPYGGTRQAVFGAVKEAVLEQLLARGGEFARDYASPWHEDPEMVAHARKPLADNPLFKTDCRALSALIWDCITPAIPRAMAFMKALQEIGSWVGERGLAWRTGTSCGDGGLWVIQAKSKAARKQVTMRGFHLPDMVRRLTLMANANEIDPRAHRTGIVANFIHSLDAAHLAASIAAFRAAGGGCVGSVHDCLLVRPSEAGLMGNCLRAEFVRMYEDAGNPSHEPGTPGDPLAQPVRLLSRGTEAVDEEFPSWYALAEQAGVALPERGSFDIEEVRESAWFFS